MNWFLNPRYYIFLILNIVTFTVSAEFPKYNKIELNNTIEENSINLSEVITSAIEVVNSFENYREIPDTIKLESNEYALSELFSVFIDAILSINDNGDTIFSINDKIKGPTNLYINIDLDSAIYEIPVTKNEYINLCSNLQKNIPDKEEIPDLIEFRGSKIRTVEFIYLLAYIIRYYHYFDAIPNSASIMITPKGLVPWDIQDSLKIYTSMNSTWEAYSLATNNWYNVGKYETYKIAKKAIGNATTTFEATKKIHAFLIERWNNSGYYIWNKPFGEPDYAYSQYRFNRSNSASQNEMINMLLRSVGIPCIENRMFDEQIGKWIGIDIHYPVGLEYIMGLIGDPLPWDYANSLSKNSTLIKNICDVINENNQDVIDEKYIWINPSDVALYGEEYILEKCKLGEINNIILSIKTSNGLLFYPTKLDHYLKDFNFFRFDAYSELSRKAKSYGIKIHAAVSVLTDDYAEKLNKNEDFAQYLMDQSSTVQSDLKRLSITPCSEFYKNYMTDLLKEISSLPNLSGIVLGYLYFNPPKYKKESEPEYNKINVPDGNPLCSCYWEQENWQEKLLVNYANDLVNAIKSVDRNIKVTLTSAPLEFSRYSSFEGLQNKDSMKNIADAYLLPIGFSQWLIPELISYPVLSPVPNSISEYIEQVSKGSKKEIIVSFSIKDEWIFTSDFYTGLAKKIQKKGANSICFHEFNSLEGLPEGNQLISNPLNSFEINPSFNAFQYSIISNLNFQQHIDIDSINLHTDTDIVEFGTVSIGLNSNRKILLENKGNKPARIINITFTDSIFGVANNFKDSIILPKSKLLLDLTFKPLETIIYDCSCLIQTASDSLIIYLNGIGKNAPIADAGNDTIVNENTLVQLDASYSFDSNNSILTYKWIAPKGIILSSDRVAKPSFKTPEVSFQLNYIFDLIVNNGKVNSETDLVIVTVNNIPKKPFAVAGNDKTVQEGDEVWLDGSSSKIFENNLYIYEWNSLSGINLTDKYSLTTSFIAPKVTKNSTLYFTLLINDGYNTDIDTVAVTVIKNGNVKPIADAGEDKIINEGDTVWLDGRNSYDLNNDSLSFIWTNSIWNEGNITSEIREKLPLSSMIQITNNSLGLSIKDIYAKEGTRVIICFTATDNNQHNFKLNINFLEEIWVVYDNEFDRCVNFFAPKAGKYKYEIDTEKGGYLHIVSILNSPYSPAPYFVAPNVKSDSTLTFALYVFDGGEYSETDQISVTIKNIKNINHLPFADAGDNQIVNELDKVYLDGSASYDPDGDDLSYFWSVPEFIILENETNSKPSFIAPEVKGDTTIIVSLKVFDGYEFSETNSSNINVKDLGNVSVYENNISDIKIYPNPSSGIVNVSANNIQTDFQVEVYNVLGQIIHIQDFNSQIFSTIDLNDLSNGVYFIHCKTKKESKIEKLIINKDF